MIAHLAFAAGGLIATTSFITVLFDNRASIRAALKGTPRHYHTTPTNCTLHTTPPLTGGGGGVVSFLGNSDQTKQTTPDQTLEGMVWLERTTA